MTTAAISRYRRHASSIWLLGYGLWWAVYYSGAIHGSLWVTLPQEEPFSGRAQLLLLSVPFGLMLVLLLLVRKWLAPLHERRGLLTGFAVATGISLALTSFGEMPFAGFAGGMAATWLPQATAALMAVVWGELYGAAGARRACLGLCGSLLVGLGISAVVRATGDVAPLSGAVFLAFCPWLSMAALFRAAASPAQVRIACKKPGSSTWELLRNVVSESVGDYSTTWRTTAKTPKGVWSWRAEFGGADGWATRTSSVVNVRVR
jgi:hypothetical protein